MEALAIVLLLLAVVPSKAIWVEERHAKTLASDDDYKSCSGDLVMIRTTEPKEHMMQRFKKIKADLGSDATIIFSVDYTSQNKSSMDVASSSTNIQKLDKLFPNSIYFFQDADLTDKFPGLKNMTHFDDINKYPQYYRVGKALAWGYHFEGFSVVIDKFEKRSGKKFSDDYCGLWLLEDDLAFSGKWTEIMDNSIEADDGNKVRADLYALSIEHRTLDLINAISWYQIASPSFKERYPRDKRWTLDSYMMYYSSELFEQVNADALEGRHAWSEMNVPTVCAYEKLGNRDCRYKIIDVDWKDNVEYFTPSLDDYNRTLEEIEQRYEEFLNSGVSKLMHPLKN